MEDQTPAPGEQTPSPAGTEWKARYDGLVRKVEQLTLDNRSLNEQLASKTSETERLNAQLGLKDTEKSAAVGERDRQLQEAIQAKTKTEGELTELRALKIKLEVAKEMGRPDLVKIFDGVPNMTDKEALKTVLSGFATFADDAVREREKQLLSGITPGFSPQKTSDAPASDDAWTKHIEGTPLGSPDRQKAFDDYWNWLAAKNK